MEPIALIKVESSNVEAIGYDREHSRLYIRFHGGKTYCYNNVPKLFWSEFKRAASVGLFFQRWIKGNFQYEVVNEQNKTR